MTSCKKRRIVVVSATAVLLFAAAGIWWLINRGSQRFTTQPYGQNPAIEDISWMGKGTVNGEDTCLVVENNVDLRHYVHFNVIPGKYVFFTKVKGKVEELKGENSLTLGKYYWEEVQTDIYDITSGSLVQSIDVKKLVEEHAPGYQYGYWLPDVFSGRNGHFFIRWSVSEIPKSGGQEGKEKYLCMDYKTGEVYLEDTLETLYDDTQKQKNFKEEFKKSTWESFREKNGYINFPKKELDYRRAFSCVYYFFVNGVARINIAATALPKENEALYSRFPGLQEYQGEEGKTVRIFLGGYPTAEEIQQLFTEEGMNDRQGNEILPVKEKQ